jgi:phosphoserine phosphatase
VKHYILCCVSPETISDALITDIGNLLAASGSRIEKTERLTEQGLRAVDLHLALAGDVEELKRRLLELSNRYQTDMALIPHDETRANVRLIVFDMDSTLIRQEVINELARVHGVGEAVGKITERAMNGELNFNQALAERVALLKGLDRATMESIMSRLTLSPGVDTLLREVKKKGFKTAIVSGGFQFFAENFRRRLGMDYVFANDLEIEDDVLTGRVQGRVINAAAKAQIVEELAAREGISLDQVVAVGDGANDLPMLAKAGFGIAYHAKELVRREAPYQVGHGSMTTLLYFLGIPGNHLDEII